jgi:hypothetical protein
MPDLGSPRCPSRLPYPMHGLLDDDDQRYIRASFVSLEQVCWGRCGPDETRDAVRSRRLPAPSYVLGDGSEMVPADYFRLVDDAGGVEALHAHFCQRFARAMRAGGVEPEAARIEDEWNGYLDGAYGVCLRTVSPEAIFEKESLVHAVEALVEEAAPDHPRWRAELRHRVDRLDRLVRPFAPCDRARFGGTVSRDRLITTVRARFPDVFADKA